MVVFFFFFCVWFFFFFNDTATTEIYTLSLHDALPIWDFSGMGNIKTEKIPVTTDVSLIFSSFAKF